MYSNTTYGHIGIRVISDSLEATNDIQTDKYAQFDIKRLTSANSFMILDEVFYIAKKECNGKASGIYHIYRVEDKRYITPAPMSKEEAIKMVTRKYVELDL